MDTDVAEIKETMARIDERTTAILLNQEKLSTSLEGHEDRDRVDFKEVHHRISRVERKQNWMLGIGTSVVFVIMTIGGLAKAFFGGP